MWGSLVLRASVGATAPVADASSGTSQSGMASFNGTYGFDSSFFSFRPDKTMTPPKLFGGDFGACARAPLPLTAAPRCHVAR